MTHFIDTSRFTRRTALRLLSASGASALGVACSAQGVAPASPTAPPGASATTPAKPAATAAGTGGSSLPSLVPSQAAPPDLPPPNPGVDAGYIAYPSNPAPSVKETPGRGGVVNILSWAYTPPVPALDQNAALQALNKQIGAEVHLNLAPLADYQVRQTTLMSSDDIPDIMYFNNQPKLNGLPEFLKAKCADLSSYLAGDAVRDFPNLAALPTDAWKGAVYDGRLYGVPVVYGQVFRVLWTHQELLDEAGVDLPKDTDDFKRVLQQVTKPQSDQYGLGLDGQPATGLGVTTWLEPMMFGAPNNWRADTNANLIKDRETDEYKASVAYTRELFQAGLFHPNTPASNNTQGKVDFAGRKVAFRWDGAASAIQFWDQSAAAQPPGKLRAAPPFAAPNTKPTYPLGLGQMGFSAIKQGDNVRVRELLGILNFLAAPFGTAEHLLVNYGVPGVHHTRDASGNPILTQQGMAEITPSWSFVVRPRPVLFDPKSGDFARVLQADQVTYVAAGQPDATLGLYSATDVAKGTVIEQTFIDGVTDIVTARRPLADLDGLVKDWQTGGGNQIRAEYQQALAASKT